MLHLCALHKEFKGKLKENHCMVCSGAVVNRELWERYRHGERGNASLERGSGVEPPAGSRGRVARQGVGAKLP